MFGLLLVTGLLSLMPVRATVSSRHQVETSRLHEIADVLLAFVHACTPEQCERLRAIADAGDAPDDERELADVLRRVQHLVQSDDRRRLQALSETGAHAQTRILARTLLRLMHEVGAADKATLRQILKPDP